MKKLLALAASSILLSSPLSALEAGHLVHACDGHDQKNFGFCMGYIGGVYEGYQLAADWADREASKLGETEPKLGSYFCLPQNVIYEQMASDFVRFMKNGDLAPEVYAETAVMAFFEIEYGCR